MKLISNILGWLQILNISIGMAAMKGALPENFIIYTLMYAIFHFIYCGIREEGVFNSSDYENKTKIKN